MGNACIGGEFGENSLVQGSRMRFIVLQPGQYLMNPRSSGASSGPLPALPTPGRHLAMPQAPPNPADFSGATAQRRDDRRTMLRRCGARRMPRWQRGVYCAAGFLEQRDDFFANQRVIHGVGVEQHARVPLAVADAQLATILEMLHQCPGRPTIAVIQLPDETFQVGEQRKVHDGDKVWLVEPRL